MSHSPYLFTGNICIIAYKGCGCCTFSGWEICEW